MVRCSDNARVPIVQNTLQWYGACSGREEPGLVKGGNRPGGHAVRHGPEGCDFLPTRERREYERSVGRKKRTKTPE